MTDIHCYLNANGGVNRAKLTQDIKNGKLTLAEVESVIKDPTISASFFGGDYDKKRENSKDWDEDYLNHLVLASVSEVFNEDYLIHLAKVSNYVETSRGKRKQLPVGGVVAAVIAVIGIIVIIAVLSKK